MSTPFYNEKIKSFPKNNLGRDFVLGDIHGRFDLVKRALDRVSFNYKTDRLFSVGDLIDRGKYSQQVLEFLETPFVHAIRGNHEDMLIGLYAKNTPTDQDFEPYYGDIGLDWWKNVSLVKRERIVEALRTLPVIIEIETDNGLVGLVHADIPSGITWQQFKSLIIYDDSSTLDYALWGRKRVDNKLSEIIDGVNTIYVGHTALKQVCPFGNVIAIDTGAVYNNHLTIIDITYPKEKILYAQQAYDSIRAII